VIFRFSPDLPVIRVEATLVGPKNFYDVSLILDTGASRSVINAAVLGYIGCAPTTFSRFVMISSATDSIRVPIVKIPRFLCLGVMLDDFEVIAHTIPSPPAFVGLLGIDFLRGREITINFRRGVIKLN